MRITSLSIYPVKSCAGLSVAHAQVAMRGLIGDRRWMLVDPEGGHVTQREVGKLALIQCEPVDAGIGFKDGPTVLESETISDLKVTIWGDEVLARSAPTSVSRWLSERIGQSIQLVHMPADVVRPVDPEYGQSGDEVSFADAYPVLIASTSSLELLNGRLEVPIPMSRFRPNIVIEGAEAFSEDSWRSLRIGDVEFDVVKSCARCVVVDTDPATGLRSKGVLRELATFRRHQRQVHFGHNAIPRGVGRVSVGDAVTVVSRGEARPAF